MFFKVYIYSSHLYIIDIIYIYIIDIIIIFIYLKSVIS